jgi:hypothetical protein
VPHYIGDKAHLNAHGPNGVPGLYTAAFVLAKPNSHNSPENEIKFADALRGESHLAITRPAVVIDINPDQVQMSYKTASGTFLFHGYPNEEGYLAKLISDPFFAADRNVAQRNAATAMQGLLSNLSSQLDILLNIEIVEVTELATQARGISFVAPFPAASMAVRGAGTINDPEFEHAVALYREALKQARPGEQVPVRDKVAMEKWLNALFYVNRDWDDGIFDQVFIAEALGRKINNILDTQLRPIRDRVAHGILDSGEFLLLDKVEDRETVLKWLPLMRCLARRVMKTTSRSIWSI